MIVASVQIAATLLARLAGLWWVPLASWPASARVGLTAMFLFTGAAHFTRTRRDLVRMVPPGLPFPAALVTLTGIAEIAGAVGLQLARFARPAAYGLIVLLVAMFPANVYAARAQHTIEGRPHTPLPLRSLLQVFWIASLAWAVR